MYVTIVSIAMVMISCLQILRVQFKSTILYIAFLWFLVRVVNNFKYFLLTRDWYRLTWLPRGIYRPDTVLIESKPFERREREVRNKEKERYSVRTFVKSVSSHLFVKHVTTGEVKSPTVVLVKGY